MENSPIFSISPDPTSMFLTPKLRDGVIRFRRAIQRKQGLCAILGDIGLGKSSLLRYIAAKYESDRDAYVVSYLHDASKFRTAFDFLKEICKDLEVKPERSQTGTMDVIEEFLLKSYQAERTVIVFVDEAQKLKQESLELLRSLLNFETNTHKLLQVVVTGQLELRDKLLKPKLESLRSRIVAPLLLEPLKANETVSMIQQRLELWGVENLFTAESLSAIHGASRGVPRTTLIICRQACDQVLDEEGNPARLVTAADVEDAIARMNIHDPDLEPVEA